MRKAAGVLMLLLTLGVQVGCRAVYEDPEAPLAVDANLRLLFAVPTETKSTTTQSYDDPANREGMDNAIDSRDLEVYFFTEAGAYITSVSGPRNLEVEPYSSGSYNPHYHMYTANMKVEGVTNGQRCRVVVLANKRSTHNTSLPFCVLHNDNWLNDGLGSTDEEKLYNSLSFNFSNLGSEPVQEYVRWNWQMKTPGCIPMWGFNTLNLKLATADAYGYYSPVEPSGQIDMLRAIAKVKIEINPELLSKVRLSEYNSRSNSGGARLISSMSWGYMTPSYSKVGSLTKTPDILNKDKVGGSADGAYTNDWIQSGVNYPGRNTVYPFFTAPDGNYYIYLPEHKMRDAWMKLEFEWLGETDLRRDYTLHFADYPQTDSVASEDELDYFPVMRNHYYVYTIQNLSMTEIKYEVCEWAERSTEIEFN